MSSAYTSEPGYKLVIYEGEGVATILDLIATDDAEASLIAEPEYKGQRMEIWKGRRLVAAWPTAPA